MNTEGPSVSIRLHNFRLSRQVGIRVANAPIAHKRLEIGCETNPVGWIDVNHLNLASEVLAGGQGVHDQQAVTQDETIRPIDIVLIELDRLVVIQLRIGPQTSLDILSRRNANGSLCGNSIMDVQRDRLNLEPGASFTLAGPFQPRVSSANGSLQELGFFIG